MKNRGIPHKHLSANMWIRMSVAQTKAHTVIPPLATEMCLVRSGTHRVKTKTGHHVASSWSHLPETHRMTLS